MHTATLDVSRYSPTTGSELGGLGVSSLDKLASLHTSYLCFTISLSCAAAIIVQHDSSEITYFCHCSRSPSPSLQYLCGSVIENES